MVERMIGETIIAETIDAAIIAIDGMIIEEADDTAMFVGNEAMAGNVRVTVHLSITQ